VKNQQAQAAAIATNVNEHQQEEPLASSTRHPLVVVVNALGNTIVVAPWRPR